MFLCSIEKEMFAVAESYCSSPPSARDFATVLHACFTLVVVAQWIMRYPYTFDSHRKKLFSFFLGRFVFVFLNIFSSVHFFNRLKLNCKSIISFHF